MRPLEILHNIDEYGYITPIINAKGAIYMSNEDDFIKDGVVNTQENFLSWSKDTELTLLQKVIVILTISIIFLAKTNPTVSSLVNSFPIK